MNKTDKKHVAHMQQNPLVLLLVGCVLAGLTYAVFVWATDSGKIVAYALFFVSAHYTIRSLYRCGTNLYKKLKFNY